MVRYLESCGRGIVPEVAPIFEACRRRPPLHSVGFLDRRNIPLASVDRYGDVWPAWAIDYVRYLRCDGRLRRAEIGRK